MMNILDKIKIDISVYLLMLFALLAGHFKSVFLILVIVIVHEIGHVFFFLLFSIDIESISIYPFGGITKVNKRLHTRIYKDILIALGGILFQILLFLIFYLLYKYNLIVTSSYKMFNQYNLSILLFNLLPLIPLDGSKLLFSIFLKFFSFNRSYILMVFLGFFSLILFVFYNVFFKINDLIIMIFLIFKLYEVFKDRGYILNKFYLERVMYDNYYDGIINDSSVDKMRINKYYYFYCDEKYVNEKDYILKNKF